MASHRLDAVLQAMADVGETDASSPVDRVCAAAVALLSLRGAGLSLMVDGVLRGTAGVSDSGIAAVQELQMTLGEGPCVDAWASLEPVMEPDLATPSVARWPAFAAAGVEAGVLAVFALPMRVGAIRVGVLVLYRDRVGSLSAEELAYGLLLADVATHLVLGLQAGAPADELHGLLARDVARWAEVHQATGMISVQLDVSLDEAFVRLRAHSFAEGLEMRAVAREILARRLRLEGAR